MLTAIEALRFSYDAKLKKLATEVLFWSDAKCVAWDDDTRLRVNVKFIRAVHVFRAYQRVIPIC